MSAADLHQRALDRLAELRAAEAEATSGPWSAWDGWETNDGLVGFERLGPATGEPVFVHDEQRDLFATRADVELIAHMRNAWPAVLDLVQAALSHRPLTGDECGQGFPSNGGNYGPIDPSCAVCGTPGEYAEAWPCAPFLRALAVLGIDPEGEPDE